MSTCVAMCRKTRRAHKLYRWATRRQEKTVVCTPFPKLLLVTKRSTGPRKSSTKVPDFLRAVGPHESSYADFGGSWGAQERRSNQGLRILSSSKPTPLRVTARRPSAEGLLQLAPWTAAQASEGPFALGACTGEHPGPLGTKRLLRYLGAIWPNALPAGSVAYAGGGVPGTVTCGWP